MDMRMRWYVLMMGIVLLAHGAAAEVSTPPDTLSGGRRVYRVPRVNGKVTVDAVLDEPLWKDAVSVEANIEVRPAENVPAPVKTEALIAYDDANLYVAFHCYDPEPDIILAHLCDRDAMFNDDWVAILFDTFNDERRSYDFFCNPLGIQGDEIETTNGEDASWDGIWYSAGRITEDGYIVEIAIPFRTISFQRTDGDQVWSFDVVRSYPRNVRHHIGAFPRDRSNNSYLGQAHKLIGFAGISPGRNIEFDPTLSTGIAQEREELDEGGYGPLRESNRRVDPGLTASWNVRPNMVLSATLNPDFSQVEADAAQMDINTRFPLNYPEKRPFFLEGSDMYTIGGLVHTRTLADPDWGLKLTGKSGPHSFGMFSARDTVTPLIFPGAESADNTTLSLQSQGTVIRYRHDIGSASTAGILLTDREGTDYYNRFALADLNLRFTKTDRITFVGGGSLTKYPADVAIEFDQDPDGVGGAAAQIEYSHDTDNYSLNGSSCAVGPGIRTDLGMNTQAGFSSHQFSGEYRWRTDGGHWYNWIGIEGEWRDERTIPDGRPMSRTFTGTASYQGPLQSSGSLSVKSGHEWYEDDRYRATFLTAKAGLKPAGSSSLNITVKYGDRVDYTNNRPGTTFSVAPSITQKIGDRLSLSLDHRYDHLDVAAGRLYTANVSNSKVGYQFTSRCFLRVILQYVQYDRHVNRYLEENREDTDPITRTVFSQVLFSYKINPRTVFFLGYSDNYHNRNADEDPRFRDDSFIQTNRAVFAKIGYAWQI